MTALVNNSTTSRQLAASDTSGVRDVDSGIIERLGRVAVVARDFCIGDTVLAEPPSLVLIRRKGMLLECLLEPRRRKAKGNHGYASYARDKYDATTDGD
jgi:hypothetical protein